VAREVKHVVKADSTGWFDCYYYCCCCCPRHRENNQNPCQARKFKI